MYTCFLFGHRDAPLALQEQLNETVDYLIRKCHATEFFVGYHGNFDHMATHAIQKAKATRPEIYAYRLIAYHPAEQNIPIPDYFDGTFYPLELVNVPRRFAIQKANQIILDKSDFVVTYVCRDGGNAAALLRKAKRMEKKGWVKTINLYEDAFPISRTE